MTAITDQRRTEFPSIQIDRDLERPRSWILESEIWLPAAIDRVFEFFSNARNLEFLTPRWLKFEVRTPGPIDMQEGTEIDYRLRVHGFPLAWRSLISVWEPPYRFVDEQLAGPYRRWHHEHTFVEKDGGTLVGDRVEYAVPGGWLVHRLLVQRDLKRIFRFRTEQLRERFGTN